ncbi:MAG: hypothetical protein QM496_13810 [Verrucomicrobiota bacterium]
MKAKRKYTKRKPSEAVAVGVSDVTFPGLVFAGPASRENALHLRRCVEKRLAGLFVVMGPRMSGKSRLIRGLAEDHGLWSAVAESMPGVRQQVGLFWEHAMFEQGDTVFFNDFCGWLCKDLSFWAELMTCSKKRGAVVFDGTEISLGDGFREVARVIELLPRDTGLLGVDRVMNKGVWV